MPLSDVPWYAGSYLMNRLYRLVSRQKRLASWGPRYAGCDEITQKYPLPVACAIQWARCVQSAESQLAAVDPTQVLKLRYEDLVACPEQEFGRVAKFLQRDVGDDLLSEICRGVSARSVGRWRSALEPEMVRQIEQHTGGLLDLWPEAGELIHSGNNSRSAG